MKSEKKKWITPKFLILSIKKTKGGQGLQTESFTSNSIVS